MTQGAQTATKATAQVATALAAGSPIGVSASLSGKIFSNIKYLNISYPEELLEAFKTWNPNFITLGFDMDIPDSIKERIVSQPVPYMFDKYEVESSFLINFWEISSVLVIVTLIFGLMRLFEYLSKRLKKKFLPYSVCKSVRVSGQNFLFTQLYNVFGDLIFFSILEWRSMNIKTDFTWLSLSLSLSLHIVMIACLCFHLKLIFTYQKLKTNDLKSGNSEELKQFTSKHEGSEVLFRDFRDDSFKHQAFLFFFTLRDLVLSFIFTTLFGLPLTQAWIIFLANLSMIIYLLMKKPFSSKLDLIQQLVFETLIFIVNISVLIMALLDSFHYEALTVRNRLGKGIIVICMIFSFATLGFVLLKLIISIRYGYQAWKAYRAKKKLSKMTTRMRTLSNSLQPCRNFVTETSHINSPLRDLHSETHGQDAQTNYESIIEAQKKFSEIDITNSPSLLYQSPSDISLVNLTLDNSSLRIGDEYGITNRNISSAMDKKHLNSFRIRRTNKNDSILRENPAHNFDNKITLFPLNETIPNNEKEISINDILKNGVQTPGNPIPRNIHRGVIGSDIVTDNVSVIKNIRFSNKKKPLKKGKLKKPSDFLFEL